MQAHSKKGETEGGIGSDERRKEEKEGKKKTKIYKTINCISEVYCLILIHQCPYSWQD